MRRRFVFREGRCAPPFAAESLPDAELTAPHATEKKGCRGSLFLPKPENRLAVVDVHRHFEAETHFGEFRLGPHGEAPLGMMVALERRSSKAVPIFRS
jgi:hypothetical protein